MPQISHAVDFYNAKSSCKTIDKDSPIKIHERVYTSSNFTKNKKRHLAKKIFENIKEQASNKNLDSVFIQHLNTDAEKDHKHEISHYSKEIKGYAIFYPAYACDSSQKLTQAELEVVGKENHIVKFSSEAKSDLVMEFTIQPGTKKISKKLQANNDIINTIHSPQIIHSSITKNSFYGFNLGMTKEEVIKQTNGFNLDIKLNENSSIHIINRNHAFIFKNNKLIGYEYGRNLLPTMIANKLPLSEISPVFISSKGNIKIHGNGLTQEEIRYIKLVNKSSKFIKIKRYSDGKKLTHLNSFKFGKTSGFKLSTAQNTCLDSNIAKPEIHNKIESNYLFRFNFKKNSNAYLTSCNQLITFKSNEFSNLSLFQSINIKTASLSMIKPLFSNITNWHFLNIEKEMSESQVVEKLNIDDAFMMNDILEFSNDNWQGYFTFNEDKVISAELSYFSSDE
jgi:hypothetical protein